MDILPERIRAPSKSKLTIWFFVFSSISLFCFLFGHAELFELNFEKLGHNELWRLLTSVFAVHSFWTLLLNVFYIFLLSCLSESEKGTVFYIFDAAVKVLLINILSALLYFFVSLGSSNSEGIFGYIIEIQNLFPSRSFAFLVIMEVFLKVTEFTSTPSFELGHRLSQVVLKIYFLVLITFYFFRMSFIAALIVALANRMGLLAHHEFLLKLTCLQELDQKLACIRNYAYILNDPSDPSRSEPGALSHEAKRLDESVDNRLAYRDEEKFEEEQRKSRHEQVNVQQYLDEHRIEDADPAGMESFEI